MQREIAGVRISFTPEEKVEFRKKSSSCRKTCERILREKILAIVLEYHYGRTDPEARREISFGRFPIKPETHPGVYLARVTYRFRGDRCKHEFYIVFQRDTLEGRLYTKERRFLSS